MLRKGRLIKIEFEFALPANAPKEQVAEWVAFELGNGSMQTANPLFGHDLEFWHSLPVLTDTEMTGRIEDFGHEPTENGVRFGRRYVREPVSTQPPP